MQLYLLNFHRYCSLNNKISNNASKSIFSNEKDVKLKDLKSVAESMKVRISVLSIERVLENKLNIGYNKIVGFVRSEQSPTPTKVKLTLDQVVKRNLLCKRLTQQYSL